MIAKQFEFQNVYCCLFYIRNTDQGLGPNDSYYDCCLFVAIDSFTAQESDYGALARPDRKVFLGGRANTEAVLQFNIPNVQPYA